MANPSNSPTNIKVVPSPGVGVEVKATFTQSNGKPATYARFQVSTDQNFGTITYDSGQVAINLIQTGTEGTMVFNFIPSTANTYYYRLCFWDDDNKDHTAWLVWNGTVVSTSSLQTVTVRPISDNSISMPGINPTTPTTHYDKIDEETVNDNDYTYNTANAVKLDLFNIQTSGIDADTLKNIDKITIYGRFYISQDSDKYRLYVNSSYFESYSSAGWLSVGYSWSTNPATSLPWTLSEVNSMKIGHTIYGTSGAQLRCSQQYAIISYYKYIFTFTPPGNNLLTIGFPAIVSSQCLNDKDKYTFQVQISDTYSKPPVVSLNIGNNSYLMDLISRTGTDVFTYTFSKTISLECEDYTYHFEVGNVWTTLIGENKFLKANYTLSDSPKIEVFSGYKKINSWNHILTENILPDVSECEFDTSEDLNIMDITVRLTRSDIKTYSMSIQNIQKTTEGYHIRASEKAKRKLEETVNFASQAVNSLNLIKTFLPGFEIKGTLPEVIYLQSFDEEKIIDILNRLLIINNRLGFVRNDKLYLFEKSNQAKYRLSKNDSQVDYSEDRENIVNVLREYYVRKNYPIPTNLFTNYDASNWNGTVTNERQTNNGLLSLSGSLYCLKGNGTIYRSVNFLFTDFDQLNMSWCPDTANSLEIRLETDSSNYRKYTRSFSGGKGAGFVLTSMNPNDIVTKTLTFADKYIHFLSISTSQPCRVKIDLKKSGSIVTTTDWQTTSGLYEIYFQNTLCDSIDISFTNLYPIGAGYGVNCSNLRIQEYKQQYVTTGTTQSANWYNKYSGITSVNATGQYGALPFGETSIISGSLVLGSIPPLQANESYNFGVSASLDATAYGGEGVGYWQRDMQIYIGTTAYRNEQGMLVVEFSGAITNTYAPFLSIFAYRCHYSVEAYKLITTSTGEWVWNYVDYTWQESYNMWDALTIPFSQFTNVGSPSNQINTIRLIASGNNYYDSISFIKSQPVGEFVEARNQDSINIYGEKTEERKTDGWSSKESATAFANAFVSIFGNPLKSYSKRIPLTTNLNIGDTIDCDGELLQIYKIVYEEQMTIFVGRNLQDTLEFLKETSRRIESIQKALY